jgi:hypothetical protein
VLYLAAQVRQGNVVARAAAQETLVSAFRNFTQPLAADAALYRLFSTGVEDLDALDTVDRGRFFHLAFQFGKIIESAHYHWQHGLLDDGSWEAYRVGAAHFFHAPGWRRYWDLRAETFSPAFREFVAALPAPARRATMSTLAQLATSGPRDST